ncbi:MAG TPA: hypothetical protein VMF91_25405 [Bryobacteraceae bacterium]|nr:hypothetical protein [Bryobacteraceae bacterium]
MKSSKKVSFTALIALSLMIQPAFSTRAFARDTSSAASQWSVEVDKIDAGDVNIEPAFRVAIYENLLVALVKTKEFQQVLRDGDHTADGMQHLLILKSTVESYTAGSETRRAVTTVSGATKLRVRTQLCTRKGQVVLESVSSGNVRFFGGNLRATHNLARNVAKSLKNSSLPDLTPSSDDSKTTELTRLQEAR